MEGSMAKVTPLEPKNSTWPVKSLLHSEGNAGKGLGHTHTHREREGESPAVA